MGIIIVVKVVDVLLIEIHLMHDLLESGFCYIHWLVSQILTNHLAKNLRLDCLFDIAVDYLHLHVDAHVNYLTKANIKYYKK